MADSMGERKGVTSVPNTGKVKPLGGSKGVVPNVGGKAAIGKQIKK